MRLLYLSSRKKELLFTVTSNLLLQVTTALCGFVLPPLVIGTFGSSVNGMISSISQFIAYLNIVEAGVGGAAIAALYKPLAQNDIANRNGILSATAKFYNRSGIVFILLVFVLAFSYPLIVGNEVDKVQSSLMVFVLGIAGAAEFFLIGKYRVLLTADKKLYVISFIQMGALILSTILSVYFINIGLEILSVKFISALVYLARYLLLYFYVYKKYEYIDFHADCDSMAISQSKNVLIHQISGLIVFNSPLVIITIFCSLKEASIYTIYAMVFNAVNQLLSSFSNGMQSFFGESLIKDSSIQTRRFFARYEILFFCIEGWFYSMAYLLIMPFMYLYTAKMSDADYIQPVLAIFFVYAGILNNIRNPASQLINAAGHFKKTQWRSVIEASLNVICSVGGIFLFGFKGVLVGTICSGLYRDIDMILYTSNHILRSIKLGIKTFFKIGILMLFYIIINRLILLKSFLPASYSKWILLSLVYGIILSIFPVCVFIYCNCKNKN